MKNILLLIALLVSISSVSAFEYNINKSELPKEYVENITLQGEINLTINLTYGNFTNGTDSIFFNNSNTTNFTINISVPDTTPIGDYVDLVKITSSKINFTNTTLNFNIHILNDTVAPETEYVQIDVGEYSYTYCDYTLPRNTTLGNIVIGGRYGDIVQTMYDENFFDIVDEFIIPVSNFSMQDIKITLGNLSAGTYDRVVKFSVISEFSDITFHFNIEECAKPITECDEIFNNMSAVCIKSNKTIDGLIECKEIERDYDNCIYSAILSAANYKIRNNTIVKYINKTEFVPVLPLDDPDLIATLDALVLTWRQMQSDSKSKVATITTLQDDKEILIDEKDVLIKEIEERVFRIVKKAVEENKLKQNTIDIYEEKYTKKSTIFWWVVFLIIIIGGGYYGYKVYDESPY